MRLIDADALLTERKKSKYYHLPNGDIAIPIIDVEHAPTVKPKPQWIPCSDRLPEERGFYLTTTKDKAVYCDHWNEDNFDRTEMVIAWMPLPEAYRGLREE